MPKAPSTDIHSSFSHLENTLAHLSSRPGVYFMVDKTDTILYVGKSVNLKSRVNSYFNGTGSLNAAKSQMVHQVVRIDTIETASDIEALVLETNLIKKHRPKYNILMKDDKNLSYIVVPNDAVGEVYRTRQKPDRGTIFGPYTSGANIGSTLRSLKQIFKIRSCRIKFAKTTAWERSESGVKITAKAGKVPPCMDYYIGLCPAPCLLTKESIEQHQNNVERLKKFLRGQMSEIVEELRVKMMEKAKLLEFEEATKIKEQITALGVIGERQIARWAIGWSADVILFYEKYGRSQVSTTEVRWGEIQGVFHTEIERQFDESSEEILEQYIAARYVEIEARVDRVIFETHPSESIIHYLTSLKISPEIADIGPRAELMKFTRANAMNYAYRQEMENLTKKTLTKSTMASILEELGYETPKDGPLSFECYDNSHTNGQFTVASRSVIVNGKSENSLYRKYKLKTLEEDKIDDFESMREIMERRTLEGLREKNFPTLILIDGGKGQLSSALEGVERGILKYIDEGWDIEIAIYFWDSLKSEAIHAKIAYRSELYKPYSEWENVKSEQEERVFQRVYFASIAKREEEIFTPHLEESVHFDPGSPELILLQKIRDEAHRFAIGFNRGLRSKAMKKNILEELPGFGPVTRRKLLKLAGSVDGILALSVAELESVCTAAQVQVLRDHGLVG